MAEGRVTRVLAKDRIRVLIVDDSAVMRSLLRSVLAADTRLEVAGTASDGESALRAMNSLKPDLVLLDVEMPVMDGLTTLKHMKLLARKVPVIMCSTLTQRGAKVTIEALAIGAADYVAKPFGQGSRESATQALAHDLIPKILALTATPTFHTMPSSATPASFRATGLKSAPLAPLSLRSSAVPLSQPAAGSLSAILPADAAVVVLAVSTGGPAALDVLLPAIPANFPLPVLIVQHMPELFTKLLADRLDGRCPMRVREATHGDPIRPGMIYIARGNWHMEVAAADHRSAYLRLTQELPENHCRPAADVLFRTAVAVYGSRVLGVVLTGMGYDGLAGSRLIREHGGAIIAQDEATSSVWGMPGAVTQAGLAQRVLPLHAIAPEILRLAGPGHGSSGDQREAFELRESAV
jgi:two-component system chemotaxis response regulator CheB